MQSVAKQLYVNYVLENNKFYPCSIYSKSENYPHIFSSSDFFLWVGGFPFCIGFGEVSFKSRGHVNQLNLINEKGV